MAKFSFEFKKKIVQEYFDGKGGVGYIAKRYNISHKSQIQRWINAYREFGDDGLLRSRKNNDYSFQFKLSVVELYLSSEVSYQELALSQGINNPSLITKWVNDFRIAGPDALRPKKKGRKKTLDIEEFKKPSKPIEEKAVDTSAEHVKELEDELLKLRIENAYLKELRRLRLEEEALLKKQRESSTVSEDSSYKGNVGKIAPNRINRRFKTSIPHQKITTDTTEFKYYEIDNKGRMVIKKLYLDPFLDMFNGEVLSYSISQNPSAISILSAQKQAIDITADCPYRRTFHSDRGWAYQMSAYSFALKENKIFQSMSRKGNCYDNSVMENFFGILKQEMYYGNTYYSFDELKEAIEKYIKYYNEKRIKEKLGWKSPVEYRLSALAA